MVALYGFKRFGADMTVEQLGEMWKEYRAGTWGSSEQARLLRSAASKVLTRAAPVLVPYHRPAVFVGHLSDDHSWHDQPGRDDCAQVLTH